MTIGEKLIKLRKESNYTQEQLADILKVSRQAISRWESDLAFPETEKLIKLSNLYNVSLDYLLKDITETENSSKQNKNNFNFKNLFDFKIEYISKKRIGNLPLVHINIGLKESAKGIIAIGLRAKGILSLGILSLGVFSFGVLSLGILSLGVFVLGLLSLGAISLGIFSIGAVAIGIYSIGAVAIGEVATGALAIGNYFAYGDYAYANLSIGKTVGDFLLPIDKEHILEELKNIPIIFRWFCRLFI